MYITKKCTVNYSWQSAKALPEQAGSSKRQANNFKFSMYLRRNVAPIVPQVLSLQVYPNKLSEKQDYYCFYLSTGYTSKAAQCYQQNFM